MFALFGIAEHDAANVRRELGPDAEQAEVPCVKYVQARPGTETCRYSVQDSIALAKTVAEKFQDRTFPAKVKIGVSGCPLC